MMSEVAVKSFSSKITAAERTKLLQEAAIMSQFNHPNVLRLYGIVMETHTVRVLAYLTGMPALTIFS